MGTVRIHHITKDEPYGPVMKTFDDVLGPRLERGETFINPTSWPPTGLTVALPGLAISDAAARFGRQLLFRRTNCVCMISEEHTAFYRRIFGAFQIGGRDLSTSSCLSALRGAHAGPTGQDPRALPVLRSTPVGTAHAVWPEAGRAARLAPLTILPTAKYVPRRRVETGLAPSATPLRA